MPTVSFPFKSAASIRGAIASKIRITAAIKGQRSACQIGPEASLQLAYCAS